MIVFPTGTTRPIDKVLDDGTAPIDLTGATVAFLYRSQNNGDATLVTLPCTLVSGVIGGVRFTPSGTEEPGLYYSRYKITRTPGPTTEFVPDRGYETLKIEPAV